MIINQVSVEASMIDNSLKQDRIHPTKQIAEVVKLADT